MSNSHILGPMQASKEQLARATAGTGKQIAAVPAAPATGVDGARIDVPSAYITLFRQGKQLGTYLVSPHLVSPQQVDVGGKAYLLQLRFQRDYRPYTVKLIDFKHDRFVGTEMARNFSSQIRLTDPENHVDREVLIYMNHPLRYAGETFYQSAFMENDKGTILQVVRNPGWLWPFEKTTIASCQQLNILIENLPDLQKKMFTESSRTEVWWLLLYVFLGFLCLEAWMT
jgi:hypothetical protein